MAKQTRRIGTLGGVCLVLLVVASVATFINLTSRAQPLRNCRGSAAVPATVRAEDPTAAISEFARQASPPPFITATVAQVPDDGWVQRSDALYEHGADDDQLLMVDVTIADGRYTVSGLWLCTPLPSSA